MDNNSSVSSELTSAAANTVKAVKSGKTAVKAAGKAASGNIAGAAMDILADENTRHVLIVMLAVFLIVLITVMYVFPMAIYEGLQSLIYSAGESFLSAYYSGTGNNLISAVWSFTSTFFSGLWDSIISGVSLSDSSASFYSDTDAGVISESDAPGDSVYEKLCASKEKYRLRRDGIVSAIESQAGSAVYAKAYSNFTCEYDPSRDEFNGYVFDKSCCTKELSDLLAIKLICLYASLTGNDFSSTRLSDYMKWLGYEGEGSVSIDVFGSDVVLPAWEGTFMPRYLCDEAARSGAAAAELVSSDMSTFSFSSRADAYREAYAAYTSGYGAPAMDFLIKAYVSPTLTSVYQTSVRLLGQYSGDFLYSDYLRDAELTEAVCKYSDSSEGYVISDTYDSTTYRYVYHSKGQFNIYFRNSAAQLYYASTHSGKRMPMYWTSYGWDVLPFTEKRINIQVWQYYKIVTYTAYIHVIPRDFSLIESLSGLVSGVRPDSSDYSSEALE